MILPPELFGEIATFLDKDINTLYSCALVCHAFQKAATPFLYKRIHVSPPKVGLAWQVVEDTLGRKPFATSRLPSHVLYVEEFTLNGYITKIRPSRQTPVPIIDKIPQALQLWRNLQIVTLTPQRVTGPALRNIIKALRHCSSLKGVTVNEFAMEEDLIPNLAELTGLQYLTLIHPTRALFMVLCNWVMRLRDTLMSLHLLGNCGSLTPGILRMISPNISNIQNLAIGLSYSLTDMDIFTCLSRLSKLKSLRLRYYRQYRILPFVPALLALQHLTVLHAPLSCKEDADALSAWIRRISLSSPLETLQVISSGSSGPSLCFDGLISHIANRHRHTLLSVQMPKAYVRALALRTLLNRCTALESFALSIAFTTLKAFPTMTEESSRLHTVSMNVCDHPKLVIEKKDAQKILQRVTQLGCVTVNNVTWKGAWIAQKTEEGTVTPEFIVSLVANTVEPELRLMKHEFE